MKLSTWRELHTEMLSQDYVILRHGTVYFKFALVAYSCVQLKETNEGCSKEAREAVSSF